MLWICITKKEPESALTGRTMEEITEAKGKQKRVWKSKR